MIRVLGVSKRFAPTGAGPAVLENVSFSVARGTIYVLLGPSGCGKTTLLRCLAGIETPDSGEISFGEINVFAAGRVNTAPQRRGVGLVFQSYAIWPHMSVFDNVAYPLRHGGMHLSREDVARRAGEALKLVELSDMAPRASTELSGGQQQRVALARAIVHRPAVLLMDEPLSNLDARLRRETREHLGKLLREIGTTTVYVTHDQAEAMALGDVVAVMNSGRIIQEGTPSDIYHYPRSKFVASFVGEMNFIEGRVRSGGGEIVVIETPSGDIRCADGLGLRVGQEVSVGFRPSSLRPDVDSRNDEHANILECRVLRKVFNGDFVVCDLAWGQLELQAIALASGGLEKICPGDGVVLSVRATACRAFVT